MGAAPFDKLVKEIDALTYNSRTVLQALIDSTVAAGSSAGFTVTRAGYAVTLSRTDIYRLWQFYRAWEENGFADSDSSATSTSRAISGYNTLRQQFDATAIYDDNKNPISSSATSTALANHARILYLNSSNASEYANDSFWYNLIPVNAAANPKLVTSSAPIPINLRTPIFDPNLSTTKYNTDPTYLFPMGYYRLDLLGYTGDSSDHLLAGNSWTISGDTLVNIQSPAVTMGGIEPAAPYRTQARRSGKLGTAWGYDTNSRGDYSSAGGSKAMATGLASVAMGNIVYAGGMYSTSIGGYANYSAGDNSGVYAGMYGNAQSKYSAVVGGYQGITGDPFYNFTLQSITGSSTTCLENCIETCTDTDGTTNIPGYDSILIAANVATLNWRIGDRVILYALTTKSGTSSSNHFSDVGGDGFVTYSRTVTAVGADPANSGTNTIVTLNQSIPVAYVDGGRVTRSYDIVRNQKPGNASVTVGGIGLVANGQNQTVVGQYNDYGILGNLDRRDTLFVVGAGTSVARSNSFEVYADGFASYVIPGDLTLSTGKGMLLNSSGFNVNYIGNSISLKQSNIGSGYVGSISVTGPSGIAYVGAENYAGILNANVRSHGNVNLISDTYTGTYPSITDNSYLGVHIVGETIYTNGVNYDANVDGVYQVNADYVELNGNGMSLNAGTTGLILAGNTYGALPTPHDSRSFTTQTSPDGINYTAFHDMAVSDSIWSSGLNTQNLGFGTYGVGGSTSPRSVHLMTISSALTSSGVNTMQMVWGQAIANNVGASANIDPGTLSIRKGIVGTTSSYTPWIPLATQEYVNSSLGTLANTMYIVSDSTIQSMTATVSPNVFTVDASHYSVSSGSYAVRSGLMTTLHMQVTLNHNFAGVDSTVNLVTMKPVFTNASDITPYSSHTFSVYSSGVNIGTGIINCVFGVGIIVIITPTSGFVNSSVVTNTFEFTVTYANMTEGT